MFAVQHGGWCATGPDARHTYDDLGESSQCWSGGKGGPWANEVYVIKTHVGCMKDKAAPNRDINEYHGHHWGDVHK